MTHLRDLMIHCKYRERAQKCVVTCSGTLPAITAQPPARDNPTMFTGVLWEQAFSVGSHGRQKNAFKALKVSVPPCQAAEM